METLRTRKIAAVLAGALLFLAVSSSAGAPTLEETLARMQPYGGPSVKGVDTTTLTGKVMCGYQGWFTTASGNKKDGTSDDSYRGWFHWGKGGDFKPGRCTIDIWPDMSELDDDEKYPTAFRHADGTAAHVFSSMNRKTVVRHFKWMQEYGIDGAFVQRFTAETRSPTALNHSSTALTHCREGANRYGRTYAVMYDTPFGKRHLAQVKKDWMRLIDRMHITSDPAYLKHKGKPVIALWGFGFSHYDWDATAARELLDFLKDDPTYGGLTIMLGIPTWWRSLSRDCRNDKVIHELLEKADILSPWTVGRFGTMEQIRPHYEKAVIPDMAWCKKRGKDYLPVVFPGFSWHNMNPRSPSGQIPRRKGRFLWAQFLAARKAGATMVYQAMFDEVDEATAIFKCTNNPPIGASSFLTYEGLPSDHYLYLVGAARKMIRGELPATEKMPPR